MQNTTNKLLTKEEISFLKELSLSKKIDALQYLAKEELGLVTVSEYHDMTGSPTRTIYHYIKKEMLLSTEILNQKAIIVNSHI